MRLAAQARAHYAVNSRQPRGSNGVEPVLYSDGGPRRESHRVIIESLRHTGPSSLPSRQHNATGRHVWKRPRRVSVCVCV